MSVPSDRSSPSSPSSSSSSSPSSPNSIDLILKAPGVEEAKNYRFWNIAIPTLLVCACIGNMFRLNGWKNIKIKFPFSKPTQEPSVSQDKTSKLYPAAAAKDEAIQNSVAENVNSVAMKAQMASKIDKLKGLNKNSKL
jgi:hypothetical protein